MGCVLALLAGGSFLHEEGPRSLVPRATDQGGRRRLSDSLAPLRSLSRPRPQLRSVARWLRAFPLCARAGVRDLGPPTYRAQLGFPDVEKGEPELVTSGPYRLVRHPIYSGILLAGVGTAVALSWMWMIAMVLAGVYFIYSATVEERYLTEQIPDTYSMYKRSTKMLVPFIF